MAERTPLFKHPLVVLFDSFYPGFCDSPGNFFSDAIPGTDGHVSLQAVNCMLFMTFRIGSLVVAFHRSHWDGQRCLSVSVTRCMIFGNQLWCSQKSAIMTRSPPHLPACPGLHEWGLKEGRHAWGPLSTSPSRHLSHDVLLSDRSRMK